MKFIYPEGATPLDDISGLKLSWIKTLSDLNQVEAENIAKAADKYLHRSIRPPLKWFNNKTLNRIHRDMFFEVWNWAGKYRTTQTIPGIKPYLITCALEELCRDVHSWLSEGCEIPIIEQAAIIHHRLVLIHPYPNGNGRFSRLISDRYLKSCKYHFPIWPKEMGNDCEERKRYISSLKDADKGDIDSLIRYMRKYGVRKI